jgi:hypothetical protein
VESTLAHGGVGRNLGACMLMYSVVIMCVFGGGPKHTSEHKEALKVGPPRSVLPFKAPPLK